MHSAHRDLETRYKRVLQDLTLTQKNTKVLNEKLMANNDEILALKTTDAENESIINSQREQLDSFRRDAMIKDRQMKESDTKKQII